MASGMADSRPYGGGEAAASGDAARVIRLLCRAGLLPAGAQASAGGAGWKTPHGVVLPVHAGPFWYIASVYPKAIGPRLVMAQAAMASALSDIGGTSRVVVWDPEDGISVAGPYHDAPELPFASGNVRALEQAAVHAGERLAVLHTAQAEETAARAAARAAGGRELYFAARLRPLQHAARRHPDLAATIEAVVRETWTLQQTLVLGSWAEDMLLTVGTELLWYNGALAHEGDPAADVSTVLSCLIAWACARPEAADGYLAAAEAFWKAYGAAAGAGFGDSGAPHGRLEPRVCRLTGVILLGTADGGIFSGVGSAHAARLRRVGRAVTLRLLGRVDGVLTRTLALLRQEDAPESPDRAPDMGAHDATEASSE